MLSNINELKNIDIVISSPYIRTLSTAKYIVDKNKCEFIIDNNLRERKLGDNKPKEFWLEQLLNEKAKTTNGESQLEVRERMLKVVNEVLEKYKNKRIVLISHGSAITFLLMNWCKLESAKLEGKIRKLSFKNKIVINDCFKTPEIFKLIFNDNDLISIERIKTTI